MKVSTILDHIESGNMALPEFQRGYVWNRGQVRDLMDSMYRKHPVGSLLVWVTETERGQPSQRLPPVQPVRRWSGKPLQGLGRPFEGAAQVDGCARGKGF